MYPSMCTMKKVLSDSIFKAHKDEMEFKSAGLSLSAKHCFERRSDQEQHKGQGRDHPV